MTTPAPPRFDLVSVGLTTIDVAGRPIDRILESEKITRIEAMEIQPAGAACAAAMVAAKLARKARSRPA